MQVPAKVRHRAAEQTLELPFPIPERQWFSLRMAGGLLDLAESTVEKLYDNGQLTGHSHNAGTGQRHHKRILRVSLVAYAIKTADYTNESLGDALVDCVRFLPPATLARLIATAQERLRDRQSA